MLFAARMALVATVLLSAVVDPGNAPQNLPADRLNPGAALQTGKPEPPTTEVRIGDVAPDFSYQAYDGHWRRLHELRAQGPVLLVFVPDDNELRLMERERARLLDLGVVPVAVLDTSPRTTLGLVQKLGLKFSVLSDPRSVIAEQFNAIDWRTHATQSAWFLLDERGMVRALERGKFPGEPVAMAAEALGRPMPGTAVPTSH
jgi:peroxiredoxin